MIVYLNGEFLSEAEAKISIFDRGFLYGDTIYETLRTHRSRIVFWPEHYERLRRSAELLQYGADWKTVDLEEVIEKLIRQNDLEEARLRITLSRGIGGPDLHRPHGLTWVVTAVKLVPLADEIYERGGSAVLARVRRNSVSSLNPEAKSGNYLNNLIARTEATDRGALEGIMLSPEGYVAEGASTNVFWRRGGILETPALSVGILHGVTRAKILEIAGRLEGLEVREVEAPAERLATADELFLTSTTWEVVPITEWEGSLVGDGTPGEVARRLRKELRALYPGT